MLGSSSRAFHVYSIQSANCGVGSVMQARVGYTFWPLLSWAWRSKIYWNFPFIDHTADVDCWWSTGMRSWRILTKRWQRVLMRPTPPSSSWPPPSTTTRWTRTLHCARCTRERAWSGKEAVLYRTLLCLITTLSGVCFSKIMYARIVLYVLALKNSS